MNIKEEIAKKQSAFDQHVNGLIAAMAGGITIVERKHLKNLGMEFHVSPEAFADIRAKLARRVMTERPIDNHAAEDANSMRAVQGLKI